MTLNKVQLIGRLTQDPELRNTQSGKSVVSFTVATSRKWKTQSGTTEEKTEFHNCSAWGKLAEIIAQYSTKGQMVYVEGELETQKWETDGVSPTLNTMQGGNRQPFIAPVLTPDRPNKRQNGRRFKENGEPSFTLTAQDKHGIYDGVKIRRLTATECERLQGFPDGWTDGISDTQRYKCLGNAVTVNVIQAIISKLCS